MYRRHVPVLCGFVGAAFALVAVILGLMAVHAGSATGPFLPSVQRATQWSAIDPSGVDAAADPGYDGQFYLELARDPFPDAAAAQRAEPAISRYRARRILWSLLAWLSGFGMTIPALWALYAWQVAFVGLGTWALARWMQETGTSAWWGLLFCLQLGTLVSVWRMVGDAVFSALVVLVILQARKPAGHAGAAFTAALLQKELAVLVAPVVFLCRRDGGRWMRAVLVPLGIAAAWWSIVALRLRGVPTEPVTANFALPGLGFVEALRGVWLTDGFGLRAAKDLGFLAMHVAALGAGATAGGFAVRLWLRRRTVLPASLAAGSFAVLGCVLGYPVWIEPWAYARVLLPLLLLTAMAAREIGTSTGRRRLPSFIAAPAVAGAVLGPLYIAALAVLGRP